MEWTFPSYRRRHDDRRDLAHKSTDDSDRNAEARSTTRQIERATAYAQAKGWTVEPRYTFTDESTLVSVDSLGHRGQRRKLQPFYSADGRSISFSSAADNLVSPDTNSQVDVFVHQRNVAPNCAVGW